MCRMIIETTDIKDRFGAFFLNNAIQKYIQIASLRTSPLQVEHLLAFGRKEGTDSEDPFDGSSSLEDLGDSRDTFALKTMRRRSQ